MLANTRLQNVPLAIPMKENVQTCERLVFSIRRTVHCDFTVTMISKPSAKPSTWD
jgi:hypothetical protein